jgi:hypothetical protein
MLGTSQRQGIIDAQSGRNARAVACQPLQIVIPLLRQMDVLQARHTLTLLLFFLVASLVDDLKPHLPALRIDRLIHPTTHLLTSICLQIVGAFATNLRSVICHPARIPFHFLHPCRKPSCHDEAETRGTRSGATTEKSRRRLRSEPEIWRKSTSQCAGVSVIGHPISCEQTMPATPSRWS